ncbi:YbfB/YjiJ family MFS transporter [Cohnella cellulosilytica]|uniref:YbfB/YjiJ family MFS transporter n=1 Tax=Cohnella cellulosilytica TaxID=986710 RepID=A0ABW2FHZ4_9BACL
MKKQTVILLIGGIAALMAAMGIGRFAFTPILPLMLEHHLLSPAGAGYLASSNYLGYLIGALVLSFIQVRSRTVFLLGGLAASLLTTWGMGELIDFDGWLLLRFLSGIASAVVFVIASSIVMDRLSGFQAGLFYGGVGAGILLTGLAVPILADGGDWAMAWKGLGAISLILGAAAWLMMKERSDSPASISVSSREQTASVRHILVWLMIAYGLEGLGYIVTGTYLVAYAKTISGISNIGAISWTLVGVAGVISCLVWSVLASRWGKKWTLAISMALQAAGIALPVLFPSSVSLIVSALLFGGTFMGITMLFVAYAKDIYPQNNRQIIGLLTTFFGTGQIIGPLVAGSLISAYGSYSSALIGAAAVVLLGAIGLPIGISCIRMPE